MMLSRWLGLTDGRIFVEANPNVYGLDPDGPGDLQALAESRGISHMIYRRKVQKSA